MDYGKEIYEAINCPPFDTVRDDREWDYFPDDKEEHQEWSVNDISPTTHKESSW
jgi:hypothetical protein